MMKIMCLKVCSTAWFGSCEKGFYMWKPHSTSDKCKDCQNKISREKKKERCKQIRLEKKRKRDKKVVANIKKKYGRCLMKVKIFISLIHTNFFLQEKK